jgi:hypothetical protein
MSGSAEYIWRGKASEPTELADEIAAMPSTILRLPFVEPIELVTLTMSIANRDLIVDALRSHQPPHSSDGGGR